MEKKNEKKDAQERKTNSQTQHVVSSERQVIGVKRVGPCKEQITVRVPIQIHAGGPWMFLSDETNSFFPFASWLYIMNRFIEIWKSRSMDP